MKVLVKILSAAGLCLTIIPAFLHFNGNITWNTHSNLMLAGMILWFLSAPVLMKKYK